MKPIVQKKYRELYENSARGKVLEIFFKFPEKEFSLSDLAEESRVSKANIGKILDELYKNNIIIIEKLSKIWRIRANRENLNFQRIKIIYNINFVYQSGLIEFLNDYFKNPKSIILFGSSRYGLDISSSDIDIAIETDEKLEEFKEGEEGFKTYNLVELKDFEREINRKINIYYFNRKAVDVHLFNNLANGFLLSGFLEVNK